MLDDPLLKETGDAPRETIALLMFDRYAFSHDSIELMLEAYVCDSVRE
jgi:hypothetical protein